MDISPIFNVFDLYEFYEGEGSEEIGIPIECKEQLTVKPIEEMEEIMGTRAGKKTHYREYLEYLVKWKIRRF